MKWMKSIAGLIFCLLIMIFSGNASMEIPEESLTDEVIFPEGEVVAVNIILDEAEYESMLENSTAEEYIPGEITYNGYTFTGVGIRPKGNSSLRDVAKSDSDRYSYKIDFNEYLDGQDFFGITKINLNNLYADPSMMAEYIGYDMLRFLEADVPRTCYVQFSINGEYAGLYLGVEEVNSAFLYDHFGDSSGALYKPDGEMDYNANDLIEEGSLEEIMNVDSFLKYLAVSTLTVHLDSYQGDMNHNYYMYEKDGVFEWITWDLNMIFNGFPMSGLTDSEAEDFLIDEPVKGSMDNYPLVQAVFENQEYIERYHDYLEILITDYAQEEVFTQTVTEVFNLIDSYVKTDPSSFYTYDEFLDGVFSEEGEGETSPGILSFMSARVESVAMQLTGEIPSTNNGEGNTGTNASGGQGERMPGNGNEAGERPVPPEGMEGVPGEIPTFSEGTAGVVEENPLPPEGMDGVLEERPVPPEGMDGVLEERPVPPEGMDGVLEERPVPPEGMDGVPGESTTFSDRMNGFSEEGFMASEGNGTGETSDWTDFIFLFSAILLMGGAIIYFAWVKRL